MAEKFDPAEEIKQVFTFTNAQNTKVVNFVSILTNKQFQSGTCKEGMVEFLNNSSIYEIQKTKSFITGHIFRQGDLIVKVGALTVNYPKFLLVQVCYPPSVQLRESTKETETWK